MLDDLGRAAATCRLIRQANAGVAAALRAGTAAATTPYVFILNSDDLAEAGALAALADALDADPGADFAFGWIHFFGDVDFVARQPDWNPWILLHANRWAISSLYRRDALDAVGGVPEGTAYEDWDLLLGLAEQDRRGLLVPRVVLHYRQHGTARRNRGGAARPAAAVRHTARPARAALRTRARVAPPLADPVPDAPCLPRSSCARACCCRPGSCRASWPSSCDRGRPSGADGHGRRRSGPRRYQRTRSRSRRWMTPGATRSTALYAQRGGRTTATL